MPRELTERQSEVLDFITEAIRENGYPPSFAEIGARLGIRSMNGVRDHIVALERKGYIQRSSKARSLQVTRKALPDHGEANTPLLPLVGRVAAGHPLLAEENIEDMVPVAPHWARRGAFCLRVHGDSMMEDGILDGDVIVVDPGGEARNGATVVAMVAGECTVKRLYRHGADQVELRPANSAMESFFYPAAEVSVQGTVTALQRELNGARR